MIYKRLLKLIYRLKIGIADWIWDAHLVPVTDNIYDIGSDTKGIRGLHIAHDHYLTYSGVSGVLGLYDSAKALKTSLDLDKLYFNAQLGISNATNQIRIGNTTNVLTLRPITTTQRNALTPVDGMIIYNSTTDTYQQYTASLGWVNFP